MRRHLPLRYGAAQSGGRFGIAQGIATPVRFCFRISLLRLCGNQNPGNQFRHIDRGVVH